MSKIRVAIPCGNFSKEIIVRDRLGAEVARVIYSPNLLGDAVWVMADDGDRLEVMRCKPFEGALGYE